VVSTALGYLGMVCLGMCALPLLLHTITVGNAAAVEPRFLALWLTGEVSMLCHILHEGATWPVKLNYIANAFMVGVIGCYRWL